jgi:hypothetical protein
VSFDWVEIASRLKGLIRVQNKSELAAVAKRLGVDERSLRISVEGGRPTLSVMAALIRAYGLDPSWVLTGDYDPSTHRIALDSNTQEIEGVVRRMIIGSETPPRGSPEVGGRRAP